MQQQKQTLKSTKHVQFHPATTKKTTTAPLSSLNLNTTTTKPSRSFLRDITNETPKTTSKKNGGLFSKSGVSTKLTTASGLKKSLTNTTVKPKESLEINLDQEVKTIVKEELNNEVPEPEYMPPRMKPGYFSHCEEYCDIHFLCGFKLKTNFPSSPLTFLALSLRRMMRRRSAISSFQALVRMMTI
jgi:hypothetical protein